MKQGQIFGITTYDALFKYVLSEDSVRPSFFHALVPNLNITQSIRLDDHMNPLKELEILRDFLGSHNSQTAVEKLSNATQFDVRIYEKGQDQLMSHPALTEFLRDIVNHYDDFVAAFPRELYDGAMDFVCQLDNKDYALIEMQIAPKNYGDLRSLAYIAAFYGNQLRKGDDFLDIRRVIGINILGGGKGAVHHWKDRPDQYIRHYKFQEQLHGEERFIDGLELIQYSLMNAPRKNNNKELQDWLTFFRYAHEMTQEQVDEEISTPAVLEAFSRARYTNLPKKVKTGYDLQEGGFGQYSHYTHELVEEGIAQGVKKGAQMEKVKMVEQMIQAGLSCDMILKISNISQGEFDNIQQKLTK